MGRERFEYRLTKDGRVLISWEGRVVTTVAGPSGGRLAEALRTADDSVAQSLLRRATGNFKRGNERTPTARREAGS